MSKVTKKELKKQLDGVQNRFAALVKDLKASGHICESVYAPFAHDYQKEQSDHDALIAILDSKEPQLKQLDQSIFDGLDEKWRFAAVNAAGRLMYSKTRMVHDKKYWWASSKSSDLSSGTDGYDASNWQNSLIERDIAKELLEVDLSSELTGSELCKAMLARGDKYIKCTTFNNPEIFVFSPHVKPDLITKCWDDGSFCTSDGYSRLYAIPINNQGEPLTQAEAGF